MTAGRRTNGLIRFFSAPPMPCPYLPGRMERQVVTLLSGLDDSDDVHTMLSQAGFRRSYNIAYKPACNDCNACIPVRLRVADFNMSRSQKRVWSKGKTLVANETPARADQDHYQLFAAYQKSRHSDGTMADMSFQDYRDMVEESPVSTSVIEFRDSNDTLFGACLTDLLGDGLSMVYSFFDPDMAPQSPGTFFILWHIERARKLGLPYVYLGYWISRSRKMAYKTKFQPLEALDREGWKDLETDQE